jgi:hypothetical protein
MPAFLDVLEQVRAAMPDVVHVVGEEHLSATHLNPPSVVWVPGVDAFRPPLASLGGRGQPQARLTCAESVQVYAWGVGPGAVRTVEADMRAAKALGLAVLLEVEKVVPGSYRATAGSWQANAPKIQLGRMYVLAFEFEAPVYAPVRKVRVTAVETETELAPAGENLAP